MRRGLIESRPGETRTAVLDGETLVDLLIQRDDRPGHAGDRYLGRVAAFDKSLQAAFVDIGLDRSGLLPRKQAPHRLHEGDAVVVEVVRDPAPGKGPKLAARPPAAGETAAPVPRLLRRADPVAELLRRSNLETILVQGDGALTALKRRLPELAPAMRAHLDPRPLFDTAGLEAAIETLLSPEVPLPGGGRLRIEPVRTLTAVDVDSAMRSGGDPERLALECDLAAARELARQLRLRALSGLIVVDFIELARKAAREQIIAELKQAVVADPVPFDVGPMRVSGLVEATRARLRPPLHEVLLSPCGRDDSGYIKSPVTVAHELLRAVEREVAAQPGRIYAATAAPAVVTALEGPAAAARRALEGRLGRTLPVRLDAARAVEDYDIETR